jgi:Ca2+-binding RTX toxin-like protein
MKKSLLEAFRNPTTTVPVAGAALGLSRNKAYQAAAMGQIPTLKFGRRIVVPTMPLLRMLGLRTEDNGAEDLGGGGGDDGLIVGGSKDVVRGNGGDDGLKGKTGNDNLKGNDGDDFLTDRKQEET